MVPQVLPTWCSMAQSWLLPLEVFRRELNEELQPHHWSQPQPHLQRVVAPFGRGLNQRLGLGKRGLGSSFELDLSARGRV